MENVILSMILTIGGSLILAIGIAIIIMPRVWNWYVKTVYEIEYPEEESNNIN